MRTLHQRIEKRLRDEVYTRWRAEHPEAASDTPPKKFLQPLMSRVDEVVEIVAGIRDYSVEPYLERVRAVICSTCQDQNTGICARRDRGECALDSYFPKIVAIIEDELKNDTGVE